jgi:hypothetical protein
VEVVRRAASVTAMGGGRFAFDVAREVQVSSRYAPRCIDARQGGGTE